MGIGVSQHEITRTTVHRRVTSFPTSTLRPDVRGLRELNPAKRAALQKAMGGDKYKNFAEIQPFLAQSRSRGYPGLVHSYEFPGYIPGVFTSLEYVESAS